MSRSPRIALLAALTCVAGLGITLLLAYFAPPFGGRDAATLQGFVDLNRPQLTPVLSHIAHVADPAAYGLIGLALILLALARRRGRVALAIAIVLVCSAVTTQALKPLLAHPRPQEWLGKGQISAAAWPSGHATAAMALALCGVLAVPARWRRAAATVGGLFALAVAYAILTLGWHFPSDVIGGFLVAALWTALMVAAVWRLDEQSPPRAEPARRSVLAEIAPPILIGAALVGALLIAAERPRAVATYAEEHPAFLLGAATIAALAALLTAAASVVTTARR
ncbi:MAG: phosphatase PAP2 family protein [Actinobacteria bacterium]|nr:MAG: phosphatase PAP2 family protein [Actinomycetota bacterium]